MNETVNDNLVSFITVPYTPKIRFLVSLSDGRTIIQDDRLSQRHAWVRLAQWLEANKDINITGLRLQGPRGIDIKMPPGQKGYFFGQKKHVVWGGPQYDYIGVGYYDGNRVNVVWCRRPKFDHSFTEERTTESAGFLLIQND